MHSTFLAASAPPVAESLAGYVILYFMAPLSVIMAGAGLGTVAKIMRRLNLQDQALALLVAEVQPKNAPSLREVVTGLDRRQAEDHERLNGHVATADERYRDLREAMRGRQT